MDEGLNGDHPPATTTQEATEAGGCRMARLFVFARHAESAANAANVLRRYRWRVVGRRLASLNEASSSSYYG
jgi:hypothetical protein